MNNILKISRLSFLLVASLITSISLADDCCRSICDIFSCGSWAYQVRAGVYPTIWRSRGDVFLNSCDCVTNTAVTGANLGELPKFNKFFKLPFIVGTQLTYAWNDCFDAYLEFNFIQANHKKDAVNTVNAVNPALAIRLGHYRAVSGYVGLHYNFMEWCNSTIVFVGAKIGAIYRSNIYAHTVTPLANVSCSCSESFRRIFFKHGTQISGGVNLGLDYCWCNNWSIVLIGEAVVSRGPKGTNCVPLTTQEIVSLAGGSALGVQRIKTEISFPVTLGLKYNF